MANSIFRFVLNNHFISGILFIIFLFFLYQIKDILVLIFIAYILTSALLPYVEYLKKNKVPKTFAVIFPFFTTIILITALIVPLVPFFVAQVQTLIDKFPDFLTAAFRNFGVDIRSFEIQSLITSEFKNIGSNVIEVSSKVFGGLFSFLTIFILSFYFLLDYERIKRGIGDFFPENKKDKLLSTLSHIEEKLGAWLRGQVTLSLFIGFLTWIALSLLNFQFALPLAVIAGILEVIPTMGPILSAVPAIIIALTISPTMAVIITVVYIIIQAIENNILVPFVMQKAVGLHPIVIILGIIIGGKLMGIEGALLSIPFISTLVILKNSLTVKPS